MKISAQEEYGLRCLLQLATLSAGESLTLNQIAEREGISQANAGKLMWLLNKAGFVQATRGTKGGYSLARSSGEIRLYSFLVSSSRSKKRTKFLKLSTATEEVLFPLLIFARKKYFAVILFLALLRLYSQRAKRLKRLFARNYKN